MTKRSTGGVHPGPSRVRRVIESAGAGAGVGTVIATFTVWQAALLAGWDVAAAFFVARVWFTVGRFDANETCELASREDNSTTSTDTLLVSAGLASLVAAALGLVKAHESSTALETLLTAATIGAIAL